MVPADCVECGEEAVGGCCPTCGEGPFCEEHAREHVENCPAICEEELDNDLI